MTRVLLIGALILSLAACDDTGIHSGVIVSKHHQDGYMYLIPVSTGNTTTMVPEFVPARYFITVRDCSRHHDDGSCFQADIEDPANFDALHVGDTWTDR